MSSDGGITVINHHVAISRLQVVHPRSRATGQHRGRQSRQPEACARDDSQGRWKAGQEAGPHRPPRSSISSHLAFRCIVKPSQECFNSPYGHVHFPVYAENIGYTPGKRYDLSTSESESVKMLASAAKEVGTWLIGGMTFMARLQAAASYHP